MKKGQGLLETVVAIGVITTGLVAVISLVISNLTTQRESAMRYQAVNLAREGLELVRNARDSNWLDPGKNTWSDLTEDEYAPSEIFNTDETPFERTITLRLRNCIDIFPLPDSICADPGYSGANPVALEIISTVTWQDQGRPREVKLTETLYDWK